MVGKDRQSNFSLHFIDQSMLFVYLPIYRTVGWYPTFHPVKYSPAHRSMFFHKKTKYKCDTRDKNWYVMRTCF